MRMCQYLFHGKTGKANVSNTKLSIRTQCTNPSVIVQLHDQGRGTLYMYSPCQTNPIAQ